MFLQAQLESSLPDALAGVLPENKELTHVQHGLVVRVLPDESKARQVIFMDDEIGEVLSFVEIRVYDLLIKLVFAFARNSQLRKLGHVMHVELKHVCHAGSVN